VTTRLPIDASVLSYYGFDEANPSDVAVDEGTLASDLIVTDSPAVVPARLGNGRQFDGALTIAGPGSSAAIRGAWNGYAGTIICWVILDSVNQVGDLLRPIMTLHGATGNVLDDAGFGLYVENTGALVYKYVGSAGEDVILRTAANVIRVNRYYSIALTLRLGPAAPEGHNGTIATLYVNNERVMWSTLHVNGAIQPDANVEAVTPAMTGAAAEFRVGGTVKNASRWHGVVDELSLHNRERPYNPYLRAAYFRLALSASFARLTAHGNVRALGAAEMGGGTRWWCYERDQSLYVIRENSLSLFTNEIQLATSGTLASGAPFPSGSERPKLVYDPVSDVLVIVFVAAGRVYKVTASSQDTPSQKTMPGTVDLVNVVKAVDNVDRVRMPAGGEPATLGRVGTGESGKDATAAPSISLIHTPSFGVAVYGTNAYGYLLYRNAGGAETLYATLLPGAQQTERPEAARYWFVPVADRMYGTFFSARVRRADGTPGDTVAGYPADFLGLIHTRDALPNALVYSRWGDALQDLATLTAGGEGRGDTAYVSYTPIKERPAADSMAQGAGEPVLPDIGMLALTPVKQTSTDPVSITAGGEGRGTMELSTGLRFE
jgi:hypothetical protein